MNRLYICLAVVVAMATYYNTTLAQDPEPEMKTLLGNKKLVLGGYAGPQFSYSTFNNASVWMVGGRGGVIVNRSLVIGGGGFGIVNAPWFAPINGGLGGYLEGGYGGLLVEPILFSNRLVHITIPLIVGAGGMSYVKNITYHYNYPDSENLIDVDPFFVLEPGVEAELNILRFVRLSAGVKYRWAPNLDLVDTPSDPFNGFSVAACLKFGKF